MSSPRDEDYLDSNLLGEREAEATVAIRSRPYAYAPAVKKFMVARSKDTRLVIGIDFGTTYTGIAWAEAKSDSAVLGDIKVLQAWTTKMNNSKIPSVYSYSKAKAGEAQWGSDISEDAITMVNTKLDLQPQETRLAELESALGVLQGADNMSFANLRKIGPEPAYPTKTPTEIITDYLTKICECVCSPDTGIDPQSLKVTRTPVDLVVTVPVQWTYSANNATFRALRAAGFKEENFPTLNEMILISEPEAASYFTVQELQSRGAEFLKVGDCFVLCDAGGGTVDVVAFQVTAEKPHLALKKITDPNSQKCGSSYIDANFKMWLRDIALGRARYQQLDPADRGGRIKPNSIETGEMRKMMKAFEDEKINFSRESRDVKIDLPHPFKKLNIEGRVNEGSLTIYQDEMRNLFNPCIEGVVGLVDSQINAVKEKVGRKLKSVLLVGGFGASKYLRATLEDSLALRKIVLKQPSPDKSWTAVVRGAVIYGVEKARHQSEVNKMFEIQHSYGIVPYNNFDWLLRKGDLISSARTGFVSSKYFSAQPHTIEGRKLDYGVYRYIDRDDDVPEEYQTGQHDVQKVAIASCNFSGFMDRRSKKTGVGPLQVDFQFWGSTLKVEVSLNGSIVGTCEVALSVGL